MRLLRKSHIKELQELCMAQWDAVAKRRPFLEALLKQRASGT
jgi:hypothetical protein